MSDRQRPAPARTQTWVRCITYDQWETVQRYFKIAAEEGARAEMGGTTALDPALARRLLRRAHGLRA